MSQQAAQELIENAAAESRARRDSATVLPPPLPAECCPTKTDLIVYPCAPPAVTPRDSLGGGPGDTSLVAGGKGPLQIRVVARDRHRHVTESAGWMTSVCLHALLIAFLGLLLAPNDFGGRVTRQLIVTFCPNDDLGPQTLVEISGLGSDDAAGEPEPEPEPVETAVVAVPFPAVAAITDRSGVDPRLSDHRGAATGGDSARGSFFGIKPVGHAFVYVLDMSGSMRGRRFQRATDELVRSVRGLHADQKFYVLLFNGSTTQMFSESNLCPAAIAATQDNKEALEGWVKGAFKGGSTDPRGALKIALRMRPSAIFMLSDGEFDDPSGSSDSGLLGGEGDAFSIVAAAAGQIPIHAIALEDPQSCKNMKRLAEMTRGQYRFAQLQDEEVAKEMLEQARQKIAGDIAGATEMLQRIVAEHGSTESGWKARKELAGILQPRATAALHTSDLQTAVRWLAEIVEIDPEAIVTADVQQRLVDEFFKYAPLEASDVDVGDALTRLARLIDQFPKSKKVQQLIDPVADAMLSRALAFSAQGQPQQSIQQLEQVMREYPGTDAAQECERLHQQSIDGVLDAASGLRRSKDDVAAVRYLRDQAALYDGTKVGHAAARALEGLATDMLSKLRHAAFYRDQQAKGIVSRQIEDAFDDDPLMERLEEQFNRNERTARGLLRQVMQVENTRSLAAAVEGYRRIVTRYRGTIAATKARDRLRELQRRGVSLHQSPPVGKGGSPTQWLIQ